MSPLIAFDARMARHTGIGRVIRGLVNGLARRDDPWRLLLIINPEADPTAHWEWLKVPRERLDRIEVVSFGTPVPIYSAAEQFWLPKVLAERGAALLHCPHFNIPLLARVPLIATLHDTTYLRHPEAAPGFLARRYAAFMLRQAARRSQLIVTNSAASAAMLEADLGVSASECILAPPSAEEMVGWITQLRRGGLEMIRPEVRELPRFILNVGTDLPHKNRALLLDILDALKSLGYGALACAVAGPRGRHTEAFAAEAARRGHGEAVKLLGEVEDRDLAFLYDNALALVQPSRSEGFGLTVLEALAAECPVVCSNIPAHREVAGGAAAFVDPDDAQGFAAQIARLELQPREAERRAKLGLERVKAYRDDESAARVAEAYRALLDGGESG